MTADKTTNTVRIPRNLTSQFADMTKEQLFETVFLSLGDVATPSLNEPTFTVEALDDANAAAAAFVDRSALVLWTFSWCYYGACLDLNIVYHAPKTFCAEAVLSFAGINLAFGEACITQNANGDFVLSGSDKIKIAGQTAAKAEYSLTIRVDYNAGVASIEQYHGKVCGSNTFELRCKVWNS